MLTEALTTEALAALIARRADVELYLASATGVRSWVPARIAGRTPGRSGIRVEVRRVDGSILAFAYSLGEARRVLRAASSREDVHADATRSPR